MFDIYLTSIIVSILFPIIGCLLIWQGKSYFADGLAHTGILAISISSVLSVHSLIIAPLVALVFALLTHNNSRLLGNDVAINVFANSMMALGIIIVSIWPSNVNLFSLFIGDILAVDIWETYILLAILLLVLVLLKIYFNRLVLLSISRDMAIAQGVKVGRLELWFIVILALILTIAMKMMGIILVSAILVIPPSAAFMVSKNPKMMMAISVVFSLIAALVGLELSFLYDLPASACIAVISTMIYIINVLIKKFCLN